MDRRLLVRHSASVPSHPLWRACSIAAALGGACTSAEPSAPATQQAAAEASDAETAEPVVEPLPVGPPPAPAASQRASAEPAKLSELRFHDDPAKVLPVRGGPRPGRGKGKLAGLELELIPLGNEAVLRVINRGTKRAWWCGPDFHLGNLYAVDSEGAVVAKAGLCPWTEREEPRGNACGTPAQGTWSLAPGESSLLIRARARQTETGLILELHDTNVEPRFEGACIVIDGDRAILEGSWLGGTERVREDWCRPKAKAKWDELSRHRQDGPWSAPLDMQWTFPPDREAIDDMPDRGHLTSNHVEVVAYRSSIPTKPSP